MKTKELTERESMLPAIPDYGPGVAGVGNEGIGEDRVVPILQLLQKGNPQVDPDSEKYIDGAKIGQLLNTATGEVHDEIIGVPFFRERVMVEWRKRELGGGGPFNRYAMEDALVGRALRKAGMTRPFGKIQHPDIEANELQETIYVGLITLDGVNGNVTGAVIIPFKSKGIPAWKEWAGRYNDAVVGGKKLKDAVALASNQVAIGSKAGKKDDYTFRVFTVTAAVDNDLVRSLLKAGHPALTEGLALHTEFSGGRIKYADAPEAESTEADEKLPW
jgi:hypothetical protein